MNQSSHKTIPFRAVANLIGVLAFFTGVVYVWGLVGEMVPISFAEANPYLIVQTILLIVGTLSLVSTLRWELIGGIVAIICGILLAVVTLVANTETMPWLAAAVYGSPFITAGILYLVDWQLSQREQDA